MASNGSARARQAGGFQTLPPPDTAEIKKQLDAMKGTLSTIGKSYQTLNEQSAKLNAEGPTKESVKKQLGELRQQIGKEDDEHDAQMQKLRELVSKTVQKSIIEEMQPYIKDQVQTQISVLVGEQVQVQIKEHLPVSLEDQIAESKAEYKKVHNSLYNSKSRASNATLRPQRDEFERLWRVTKSDGEESKLFPVDLQSLFAYDLQKTKDLVKDYGLAESNVREANLNKFMNHIGLKNFDLVAMPPRKR